MSYELGSGTVMTTVVSTYGSGVSVLPLGATRAAPHTTEVHAETTDPDAYEGL